MQITNVCSMLAKYNFMSLLLETENSFRCMDEIKLFCSLGGQLILAVDWLRTHGDEGGFEILAVSSLIKT